MCHSPVQPVGSWFFLRKKKHPSWSRSSPSTQHNGSPSWKPIYHTVLRWKKIRRFTHQLRQRSFIPLFTGFQNTFQVVWPWDFLKHQTVAPEKWVGWNTIVFLFGAKGKAVLYITHVLGAQFDDPYPKVMVDEEKSSWSSLDTPWHTGMLRDFLKAMLM